MPATESDRRLVDTSVWIRADRRGNDSIRERLKALLIAGFAWICWPIRTELLIGVKTASQWTRLDAQFEALEHTPITNGTWRRAASLGNILARRGKGVPLPDLIIAAAALEQDLTLWTVDEDFKRVSVVSLLRLDWFGLHPSR